MRWITIILLWCCSLPASAQFTQAGIGINGLTCSQCSRSVEMHLRKLPFVKDVQMDLQRTEGIIVFKDHSHPDMRQIARAVTDAGFSVRYLNADFIFHHEAIIGGCFSYDGYVYHIIKPTAPAPEGPATITFIGPGYLPVKELKAWKPLLTGSCSAGDKAYYITLAPQHV